MFHRELIISVAGDKQTGAKPVARSSSKARSLSKVRNAWDHSALAPKNRNRWDHDESSKKRLAGRRILLAEDEGLIALELVEMLRDLGCDLGGPLARLPDHHRSPVIKSERGPASRFVIPDGCRTARPKPSTFPNRRSAVTLSRWKMPQLCRRGRRGDRLPLKGRKWPDPNISGLIPTFGSSCWDKLAH
jgi:hypothetical protein